VWGKTFLSFSLPAYKSRHTMCQCTTPANAGFLNGIKSYGPTGALLRALAPQKRPIFQSLRIAPTIFKHHHISAHPLLPVLPLKDFLNPTLS